MTTAQTVHWGKTALSKAICKLLARLSATENFSDVMNGLFRVKCWGYGQMAYCLPFEAKGLQLPQSATLSY